MLIYHCCCLRAAVSIHAVEIEGGDAMLAECARECGAAIHRFGCVISHISNCSPSTGSGFGQWVCNLRAGNAVASGESRAKRRRVPGRLVRIGHFHSEYFAKRWTFRPSRDRPGRRRCGATLAVLHDVVPASIQHKVNRHQQEVRTVAPGHERIHGLQCISRQLHVPDEHDDGDHWFDLLDLSRHAPPSKRPNWLSSTIASTGRNIKRRRPSAPLVAVSSSYPFCSNNSVGLDFGAYTAECCLCPCRFIYTGRLPTVLSKLLNTGAGPAIISTVKRRTDELTYSHAVIPGLSGYPVCAFTANLGDHGQQAVGVSYLETKASFSGDRLRGDAQSCSTTLSSELWTCRPPL